MSGLNCRFCHTQLSHVFADLGASPLSNSYLKADDLNRMEAFFPLKVYVCESCHLVQLPEYETPENIFSDYAYFSSYSDSFVAHARDYVHMMTDRFKYNGHSYVVEIASNDGYLLQFFQEKGVRVRGVEPAANVAEVAVEKGIPTVTKFFGVDTAQELAQDSKANLLLGNNVLAHVPDINDFVGGMKVLLDKEGVITMEFPHLLTLMELNQYDTIYHEHFSYLSLHAVEQIFSHHDMRIFDVEEIWTHGGSLRVFACHSDDSSKSDSQRLTQVRDKEAAAGFGSLDTYLEFQSRVDEVKRKLLDFLIEAKEAGQAVVGYGAPAKGNTLLNHCGIRTDLLKYTVDRSPHKQDTYLPGTRIPVYAPEKIFETKPDFVLILPWNFKDEIMQQMREIRDWGGQFVVPIPEVQFC